MPRSNCPKPEWLRIETVLGPQVGTEPPCQAFQLWTFTLLLAPIATTLSFSQPLCQIDKRAAPAGHTRRTALTPRVTFRKSRRDVIAFGCYRTRWDSHINLRMRTYHFSWLETITKNVELRGRCVSPRRHSARSFRSRKQTVPPAGMWYVAGGMWGPSPTYHVPPATCRPPPIVYHLEPAHPESWILNPVLSPPTTCDIPPSSFVFSKIPALGA